ncbi:MAG: oxidoreductase [Mesorhizobium sp.]|uniref:oxidoreductase n=1 Tax=Mesorhizobium sp. TaxID=1871066 RepID=UPI000FE725A4|nr:FAD-dependent oxidoreductase [Mesorhizobium sp.]RWO23563.1 MAG: oxidoreductase [Mesorhizobium sp.]
MSRSAGQTRFPHLLSPLRIGSVEVRNRIFSSGHETCLSDGPKIGADLIAYHEARAKGGAGLIICEIGLIDERARPGSTVLSAASDDCIAGYSRLAQAVHSHGAKLFAQMFHPGRDSWGSVHGGAGLAFAPSPAPNERFRVIPRAMPASMVWEVISLYGDAAARMKRAGLDGVEIVASHGFLPAQFMNERTNWRSDEFGGSFANRLRFIREVALDMRRKAGDDFVIGMRISGDELSDDGLEPRDVVSICSALDGDNLLDFYHLVMGTMSQLRGSQAVVPPMDTALAQPAAVASAIRKKVKRPVFAAGRINHAVLAEELIASGQLDMCAMTRSLISDPEFPKKVLADRLDDIRLCIGCNQACIGRVHNGQSVSCIQFPESGRELKYGTIKQATQKKTIAVVGGGPAGLKAAAIAAARGHDVTLFEKAARVGGQGLLAQRLPGRSEFGGLVTNLEHEAKLAGVRIRTRTVVTSEMVMNLHTQAVVLATGAKPRYPQLEMIEGAPIIDAWQAIRDEVNVGTRIVIADWRCDWIGLGLAEKYAQAGHHVRLAVTGGEPGQAIQSYVRNHSLAKLHKLGVEIVPYARVIGADSDSVYFEHALSGDAIICEDVNTLILAQGHSADTELEEQLRGSLEELHVIGDCLSPRTAEEAVREGLEVGSIV